MTDWSDFPEAPAGQAGADPWAQFPEAPRPGMAADVAKSAGSGLVKGVISAATTPRTMIDAGRQGAGWLASKVLEKTGLATSDEAARVREAMTRPLGIPGTQISLGGPSSDEVKSFIERNSAPLYQPQTVPGQYAQTVAEFAPGALAGSGGIGRRVAVDWLAPALASETAGQATKGTALEPWARAGAAIATNLGGGLAQARQAAPERAVRNATAGVTPDQFASATALQRSSPVPLTGPEAIDQVTGGGTRLGDLARVVENSEGGGPAMRQFHADRPDHVRNATAAVLDWISPQSAAPSTLGPRAAEAAQASIDGTRRQINETTQPFYRQAEAHTLSASDFDPIARDPAFQVALQHLRNDPVLGPAYAGLPDRSVAVIDAVTKRMSDRGETLSSAVSGALDRQAAAAYQRGSAEARDVARTPARGGSEAYDTALTMQEAARRDILAPLEQGPLGQVARAGDTRQAYDALMPRDPLSGSQGEVGTSIRRLAQEDPQLAADLIRQGLGDRFNESTRRLVGGENQFGGARFARDVAGNPQQETNLRTAVQALPNGGGVDPFLAQLLEAMRATGQRKPAGSATSFNTRAMDDLAPASSIGEAVKAAKTGGVSLFTTMNDAARRAWLGRNTGDLASLFLQPDSAASIGAMAARPPQTPFMDAMLRGGVQGQAAAR